MLNTRTEYSGSNPEFEIRNNFISVALCPYNHHAVVDPEDSQGLDLTHILTGISGVFFLVLNFENLYFFGY